MGSLSQEKAQKLYSILALGPLVVIPVLAVHFPRLLAYLPIVSALLGGGVLLFGLKQTITIPKSVLITVAVALGTVWLSMLWAVEFDVSLKRAIKLSILLPVYGLFFAVIRGGRQYISDKFFYGLLVSCALAAVLTSLDLLLNSCIYRFIHDVPLEEFKSTAVFNRGALTSVLLFLLSFMLLKAPDYKRIGLLVLPMLAMLFLVQSQSAQMAFILCIGFYLFFPISKRWAWFGLFGAIIVFALGKPYLSHILNAHTFEGYYTLPVIKGAYLWHRFEVWDFVSDHILNHNVLLGSGLEITKTLENDIAFGSGVLLHPHSLVLQIWIEFGLAGIMLALGAIGLLLKTIYQTGDTHFKRAALTAFVVIFAVANFSYGMWQSWWLGLLSVVIAMHLANFPGRGGAGSDKNV